MNDTSQTRHLPRGNTLILTGVVVTVLGVLALFSPVTAGGAVITMIGAILLIAGIVQFIHAYRTASRLDTMMSSILGAISAGAGVLLLVDSDAGSGFLTIVMIAFFVLQGLWKLSYAFQYRRTRGWVWLLVSGVVSLVLAWMMWKQWPLAGAWAIGVLVGVDLTLSGLAVILLALSWRSRVNVDG